MPPLLCCKYNTKDCLIWNAATASFEGNMKNTSDESESLSDSDLEKGLIALDSCPRAQRVWETCF